MTFTTTLSMWLGIVFLGLAVVAVLLQAWLWGPPFWDEEAKKTRAPKFWLRMHALAGYAYGAIYVVMMWHMVPRLWRYQTELPARTVVHAVAGITIGVLLVSKIVILRRFRHFEEAMPKFGFGLLLSTVVLVFLSVPYALVASDLTGEAAAPENLARVRRHLAEATGDEAAAAAVATPEGLARGRAVLTGKCTSCHDMRTILRKPRTAGEWLRVVERMRDKPMVFGVPVEEEDVLPVTAYLAAVTPRIQRSERKRAGDEATARGRKQAMLSAVADGADRTPPAVDPKAAEALLASRCTECHERDTIEGHGGDYAEWLSVVAAMVEEGAEVSPDEARLLAAYLAERFPEAQGHEGGGHDGAEGEGDRDGNGGDHGAPGDETGRGDGAPAEADPKADRDANDPSDTRNDPTTPLSDASGTGADGGNTSAAGSHGTQGHGSTKPPAKKKPHGKHGGGTDGTKPSTGTAPKPDLARGRAIFLAKCKTCHGRDGRGQTAYGKKLGVPDLSASSLSSAALRRVILDGRPGTKMRPFRGKIEGADLDAVVAFVRSLR